MEPKYSQSLGNMFISKALFATFLMKQIQTVSQNMHGIMQPNAKQTVEVVLVVVVVVVVLVVLVVVVQVEVVVPTRCDGCDISSSITAHAK